jgi:hypothetical protein
MQNEKHERDLVIVAVIGMVAIVAMFLVFLTNQKAMIQEQQDLSGQAWLPSNFCDSITAPSTRAGWMGSQGAAYCYCNPGDMYCDFYGWTE